MLSTLLLPQSTMKVILSPQKDFKADLHVIRCRITHITQVYFPAAAQTHTHLHTRGMEVWCFTGSRRTFHAFSFGSVNGLISQKSGLGGAMAESAWFALINNASREGGRLKGTKGGRRSDDSQGAAGTKDGSG